MNNLLVAKVAMVMFGVSFMFYLLSNYLPVWGTTTGEQITIGLWKVCFDATASPNGQAGCAPIKCSTKDSESNACVKSLVARIMITAACIFTPIAAILLVLFTQKQENFHKNIMITMKALFVGSLLTGILGLAVGISGTTDKTEGAVTIGRAAIFAIVAVVLNFFGTVAGLLIRKEE